MKRPYSIAILLPCCNEELVIAKVINKFKKELPDAVVYVYDNNSTDKTIQQAKSADAIVCQEPLQGKGNVVRRMFADIEADIYLLADGDDTYDYNAAPLLIKELVEKNLDMVCAARVAENTFSFRSCHKFGNKLLTSIVARLFGNQFSDMLTGYRAFSHRFVKSFPSLSSGFEIETELTIHALELRMPVKEIEAVYCARSEGSVSKLNTFRDGLRILITIILLFKEIRPFLFFFFLTTLFALASLILAWPIVVTYIETGLVPRFPTAILSTGLMLLAFISLTCGVILNSVARGRCELKRMHYLSLHSFTN